ncbi:MAG: hypothetical protein ACPG42_06970 [Alphaproteobacteria bacterium]
MSFLEPWILLGMAAGVFQALRVAGQKALSQRTSADVQLSSWSAALARCLFGLPWAVLILVALIWLWGAPTGLGLEYWLWIGAAAVFQILATIQQTLLLGKRNLAIGVVYVKTEVVIVALIGSTPFFAQYLTGLQWMAVLVSVIGVVVITRAKLGATEGSVWDLRSAWLGLSGGVMLAATSLTLREGGLVLIRDGAALGVEVSPAVAGMTTLVGVLVIQCVVVIAVMAARDASEFSRVTRRLRPMALTGLLSALGSACWFIGYVMMAPALVKSVGQVEFFAAVILSFMMFRERPTRTEWIGMSFVLLSILMLLLSTL